MSVYLMGEVFQLDLSTRDKFVLLSLADHADHEGKNAFPGTELLSEKTGYSQRTVRKSLRSLEEKGLINPVKYEEGGRNKATVYEINLKKAEVTSYFSENPEADDINPEADDEEPPEKGEVTSPQPSCNKQPSNNHQYKPEFTEGDAEFKATQFFIEKMEEFAPEVTEAPETGTEGFDRWATAMDRLHRLGVVGGEENGFTWREIKAAIIWVYEEDDFWRTVIESTTGLRKNFGKIWRSLKSDGFDISRRVNSNGTGSKERSKADDFSEKKTQEFLNDDEGEASDAV